MTETWRPVLGYEGHYEVSSLGRVRSLKWGKVRYISIDVSPQGYPRVSLWRSNRLRRVATHVLVLEAFIGPRPAGEYEACHNDGNPANSTLSNLRWDTATNNQLDRWKHGTMTRAFGELNHATRYTDEQVTGMREMRATGLTYREVAEHFGCGQMTVWAVVNGKSRTRPTGVAR